MGSRKCLKIGCGISVVLVLIIVGVMLILYFTILKPKQPILTPQSVTLQDLNSDALNLSFTLGISITVDNRNYGSFKYQNGMSYVTYRGTEVANALVAADTIPARAKHNISTSMEVSAYKLVTNGGFLGDIFGGVMNFTSSTALSGEAKVLFISKKATSYTTCDISIGIKNRTIDSVCKYKLKL